MDKSLRFSSILYTQVSLQLFVVYKTFGTGAFLKIAYITGILPIKKYGTQSALNNFREHTMTSPRQMAEYVGFTEAEVKSTICNLKKCSNGMMGIILKR